MKRLLQAVVLLLGLAVPAFGQETLYEALTVVSFKNSFSLEAGTGYAPLHSTVSADRRISRRLSTEGQFATDYVPLSFTLAGALRTSKNWEIKLIADFSWYNCGVKQCPTFGVDPEGKPRYKYDYENAEYLGRKNLDLYWSLTCTFRRIWNPFRNFQLYSEFGLGLVSKELFYNSMVGRVNVVPSITPIGARYCWEHFYLFAEVPISPYATLIHGGVGWKFN